MVLFQSNMTSFLQILIKVIMLKSNPGSFDVYLNEVI